jgi:hypothetical protein
LRRPGIIEVVAYTLCALVARPPAAVVLRAEAGLGAVELAQGLWMVPLGRSARGELGEREAGVSGFWCLTAGIEGLARHASLAGPVGYLEAEFFGGVGTQAAVAWWDDKVLVDPSSVELGGPDSVELARSPFNQVLRRLGVLRREAADEFDAVGLNRYRSTEDWVRIAAR